MSIAGTVAAARAPRKLSKKEKKLRFDNPNCDLEAENLKSILLAGPGERSADDLVTLKDFTANADVWAGLHEKVHRDCCRLMTFELKKKGRRLYAAGDPVGNFDGRLFFVLGGTVRLVNDETGMVRRLHKGGDCGGGHEFTAKGSTVRAEAAFCDTECMLGSLRKADFHQAIIDHLERTFRGTTNFLKSTPLIKAARLSEEECFKLAMALTAQEYPSNATLISQGQQPRGLYLLQSGVCSSHRKVKHPGKRARDFCMSEVLAGSCFGEEAVLNDRQTMPADSIVSRGTVEVLWITAEAFDRLKVKQKLLEALLALHQLRENWRTERERVSSSLSAHGPLDGCVRHDDDGAQDFVVKEGESDSESEEEEFELVEQLVPRGHPDYRESWDNRPLPPRDRPRPFSRIGDALNTSYGTGKLDLGKAPAPPHMSDDYDIIPMPSVYTDKFKEKGPSIDQRPATSQAVMRSSPDKASGGSVPRRRVDWEIYHSRFKQKFGQGSTRDKAALSRAAAPIRSWTSMGLPRCSRVLAREQQTKSKKQHSAGGSNISYETIEQFKKQKKHGPPAKMWESKWDARGWVDAAVVTVDDIPLVTALPPQVRKWEQQSQYKLPAAHKSSAALSIFSKLQK